MLPRSSSPLPPSTLDSSGGCRLNSRTHPACMLRGRPDPLPRSFRSRCHHPDSSARYFLHRPIKLFWTVFSIAALAFALTASVPRSLSPSRLGLWIGANAISPGASSWQSQAAGNDVTRSGRYLHTCHTHRAHSTHPPRAVGRRRSRGIHRPVLVLPLVRPVSRPLTRLPNA